MFHKAKVNKSCETKMKCIKQFQRKYVKIRRVRQDVKF